MYLTKNRPASVAQRIDALPETDQICMPFAT